MTVNETAISEAGGVWGSGEKTGWVEIKEVKSTHIAVSIQGLSAYLTPDHARSLARQLYRLARRIDAKIAAREVKT